MFRPSSFPHAQLSHAAQTISSVTEPTISQWNVAQHPGSFSPAVDGRAEACRDDAGRGHRSLGRRGREQAMRGYLPRGRSETSTFELDGHRKKKS